MRSYVRFWPLNSIRFIQPASVLCLTLPLIAMLLYNNFYAVNVVREQVAESYRKSLSLYMGQIDSQLNDIEAYIIATAYNMDLQSLSTPINEDEYYFAKFYLKQKINNDIALYRNVNGFFVYEGNRHDYMDMVNKGFVSNEESSAIQDYMTKFIDQHRQTGQAVDRLWQHYEINQKHYLIDIIHAGDAYLGAWVSTDRLIEQLNSLDISDRGGILLTNEQGKPVSDSNLMQENGQLLLQSDLYSSYLSNEGQKYLVVSSNAKQGAYSLVALIPDEYILASLPDLRKLTLFIALVAVILIPFGILFMRRTFLVPLNKILVAMKTVRRGDWGVRVVQRKAAEEFNLLADSFNAMMTEIQTLRINVFEEQLDKQKEELRRLQLQINPHFFLNSLNIVYNLAIVKNHDLIMQMTLSLIKYFRYLFRSNTSFVVLQNELEHTRNYLQIQDLRFPKQLTWSINAPNFLLETPVPPLMIQTFVENAIKHAVTLDEPIDIMVNIDLQESDGGSKLIIVISDNGIGFNEEVLVQLQSGRSVENEHGERTGIWNVHRRLRLLYGDTATIEYSNDKETGGAVIKILLPTEPEMEGLK
ncbi:HAMP domain-containing protein [Paenibacillus oralis]|uniref:HAMP domain-containing protein n=1 Tax=Paenibacillus oralis TaxID=2490856 RepID=A0A3P3U4T6_9BACL|nr:histidine kinase [Paenibacillus oralis]RRJ64598.1 HAMP domain-containing protein [Paenibacillus oralis]